MRLVALPPQNLALTLCCYYCLQRIRSYSVRLGSSGISVPNFLKIGQLVQKFKWGVHSQHGDHISLPLIFSEGKVENISACIATAISVIKLNKLNSVAVVRKRTLPTERPPLVGEVSANLCG
jgi:hypothetical protein